PELQRRLVGVVQEGEKLVIFALRDRVELVIVALATTDRQPEEDRAGGIDAIDDRLDPELLDVDAAFLIAKRIAVEAGRHLLALRGVGEQIAGELLDGEAVERQVA